MLSAGSKKSGVKYKLKKEKEKERERERERERECRYVISTLKVR